MTLAQSSFRNRRGLPPGITAEVAEHELNAAFGLPIVIVAPKQVSDPYLQNRLCEEAMGREVLAQLTYDDPLNVRARKVAALREAMSKPFEPRFPPEGRSDRVYPENRR